MSLIRKHVAVLQAWACLALVYEYNTLSRENFDFSLKYHSSSTFNSRYRGRL